MNFTNMHYYLTAAEERSFTKAAKKLHITQQTLSASISSLEKELGCSLFIRHVPLELTYEGMIFQRYAESFSREYQMMLHEFNDINKEQRGLLRVGIAYTRGRTLMPAITAAFQKKYPHYQVELIEGSNQQLREKLLDNAIDIAIASFQGSDPAIDLYAYYEEEIVLVISKRLLHTLYGERTSDVVEHLYNTDLSILEGCPFLLGHPEDVSGSVSRYFLEHFHLRPEIRATSDSLETLLAMCEHEIGACFCPKNFLKVALSKEQLDGLYSFPLTEEARYPISFCIRHQQYQWKVLQDFMTAAATPEKLIFQKE